MSRQAYLRSRPWLGDRVDNRPLEAAVLDPTADTMRDMVQNEVRAMVARAAEIDQPDDDFLPDDEAFLTDEELILSGHQVDDYADWLLEQQDPPDPDPPAKPVLQEENSPDSGKSPGSSEATPGAPDPASKSPDST